MGTEKIGKILIAIMLLIMAFSPLSINMRVSAEGTRAPDYYGNITSDAIWSGNKWFHDVTIDPGVTVTVNQGTVLNHYGDSYIWVQGTLIVKGTDRNPVIFGADTGFDKWVGITVNETGRAIIDNATLQNINVGSNALSLYGLSSIVRNSSMIGGSKAIYTDISNGGHYLEALTIKGQSFIALHITHNVDDMTVKDVDITNVGWGAICVSQSQNVTIEDVITEGGHYGYAPTGNSEFPGRNITFKNCIVDNRSAIGPAYGFWMENHIDNIEVISGSISNCDNGVYFDGLSNAGIRFEDFRIRSNVDNAIYGNSNANFSASFVNCDLGSSTNTVYTRSNLPQRIELINCTYSDLSDFDLGGDIIVNISYFTNVEVLDGNGDPTDANLQIEQQGLGTVFDDRLPRGWLDKYPLQYVRIDGSDSYKIIHDFKAVSNLPSQSSVEMNDVWITEYETVKLSMDLDPYNEFPSEIEFEEDDKYDIPLNDYFFDPEGGEFTWDVSTGPELVHHLIQGQETLRLESSEENWFGSSWVYINATDTSGIWTDIKATVTVTSVNDPPVLLEDLPTLITPEDTSVWINFSGRAEDDDGDPLTWSAEEIKNCTLTWDDSGMNLTITPVENWFGVLEIPVKVSDGTANPGWTLTVEVTSVNDIPEVKVLWSYGTEVDQVEYLWNETTNITVWEVSTMEDVPVEFGFHYDDVETDEPDSILIYSDPVHGALDLTVYQREEIVNTTTNETAMVDYTISTNYTYSPDADDHSGDLIQFNISDGEEEVTLWIWFNVESVNDRPVFDAPDDWNVTVDMGNETVIDIGSWTSDVDGDPLSISVDPDDYITIEGTQLRILYDDTFEGDHQNITVTVSDDVLIAGAVLRINVNKDEEPGPGDDDDEPVLGSPKVSAEEDRWVVEVEGDDGFELWVVVEDEDGDLKSYKMTYKDGKYTAEIPKDDAEKGFEYHISDTEDGDPLTGDYSGSLPALKEEEEEEDIEASWWVPFALCCMVVIVVVILLIFIMIFMAARRKGRVEEYYEE